MLVVLVYSQLIYLPYATYTSIEAYELVYTTNLVTHLLWGVHNLHLFLHKGNNKEDEWRRSHCILLYSLFGACGSGALRNYHALAYGTDDDYITNITWIVEWISLGIILLDLCYFLVMERNEWGMVMQQKKKKKNYGTNKTK